MKKFYTGIGSREVPKNIYDDMTKLATDLHDLGYTLRSGNAHGSDQAFAKGCMNNGQIWLPWRDFNQDFIDQYPDCEYRLVGDECKCGEPDPEAWDSVEKFHPNFHNMNDGSTKFYKFLRFMSRNYRQVIGWGELDSEFVICWTPGGKEIGGTAQAMRIARHYHIPVYNMFDMSKEEILKQIKKLNLIS